MVLGITGHRPDKLGGYLPNPLQTKVRDALYAKLDEYEPDRAISGFALGVDQWFAEACIDRGVPLVAAIPFAGQEKAWPEASQKHWLELLGRASEVVYVSGPGYAAWKMQARNKWVVDHVDRMVAVWDGSAGGTRNCVEYAVKKGRAVDRIDPSVWRSSSTV